MPQLSIPAAPTRAYAGQLHPGAPKYAVSGRAETATVSAGMPVKWGTASPQVEPFEVGDVPNAGMFAGIVLLETSRAYSDDGVEAGDPVSVLRMGVVSMNFSEAVTRGEQVGYTLATGVLTGIPQGTAAGAITTGIVVLPGLRIAQTISAAGLAEVEVNLFGSQDAATVGSL